MNHNVKIRKATKKDLFIVHQLVKELATFEKEPDAVVATLEEYQHAFDDALIDCHIAVLGDEIIGMTVFYMTFSTWRGKMLYLEDFFVKPEYRKSGVGQLLFDAFLDEAKKRGCRQVKWQVLDWNEVGLNFYHKNNAVIEKGWWNGKIYFNVD